MSALSNGLSHLHWREPLWLLLALLPWLAFVWRKRRGNNDRLQDFADPPLLQRLLIGAAQRPARSLVLIAAWTLAALAAAGPYWQPREPVQAEQRGADIAVIVDISPSMGAADITPTRLERAKRELHDFAALLGNDRLGLVVFSANAYTVLPLTADHDAFLRFVDLLDPTLVERPGSNVGRAMEVAERLLHDSAADGRAMLLISDGEYHDPETLAAARRLGERHIPLFILGVGTESGAPVPDNFGHFMQYQGQTVISRLDRGELQTLAKAGQGAYFDLRQDNQEWRDLISRLRKRTRAASYVSPRLEMQGIALYPWLLAASLALFLWSGARRGERPIPSRGHKGLALVILPLLLIHPVRGEAAPWTERQAYEALQQGDFAQAQTLYGEVNNYSGQMGLGAAAYRRQEWQTALDAFKRAAAQGGNDEQKASALYNTGNALAQLHRFAGASEAYRTALRLQPHLTKAALNLSLVNQFLDANRGEQQRKNAKEAPLPNTGPTRPKADELDRQSQGDDRHAIGMNANKARDKSPQPPQAGSQAGRQTGGATPPRETPDARLQQTLALWRNSAEHGSGSPQLEALQDNSAEFLRRRFSDYDHGPDIMIIDGKPW